MAGNSSKKRRKPKSKSSRKPLAEKRDVNENLAPGHRFDEEIANVCSNLLLKAQFRRVEKPTSIETLIRKELRVIVARKKLSRVATYFFENILEMCEKHPFERAATRIFEATYKEYTVVLKHMNTLKDISMFQRINNLVEDLKSKDWLIESLYQEGQNMPDEPFHFFAIHKDWEKKFNEDGRLMESMSIAVRTENMNDLTELAYKNGLLLHRLAYKHVYFHLKIHPDNNVPGIPLSPPSIQIDDD